MNREFPKIKSNQYALLITESTTGIILSRNLNYNEEDDIYLIFDSIDSAKNFIEVKEKENTFFTIYDWNKKVVFEKHFDPFPKERNKNKKWQFWKK